MIQNDVIRLVPADVSLAEAVLAYYRRNRDFLRPFEPVREEDFFTLARQRELLQKEMGERQQKTAFRFYIVPVEQPCHVIGSIALGTVVWAAFRSCFLGYKLDRDYLNRGYMTGAVGLVVDYAFRELRLHRVEANVMPRNSASLRVLEKNHFQNEGLARHYLNINGVWEDHIHMVKLNEAMHRPPADGGDKDRREIAAVELRTGQK